MSEILLVQLLIITALITLSFKLLPLFVKLPENNPFVNKFFEALPYSVLVLMVFPDIFTSGGTSVYDVIKILIGMAIVAFLSLKKYGLGMIVTISLIMIFLFDLAKIYLG